MYVSCPHDTTSLRRLTGQNLDRARALCGTQTDWRTAIACENCYSGYLTPITWFLDPSAWPV